MNKFLLLVSPILALAQTTPGRLLGTVTSVNPSASEMSVANQQGEVYGVKFSSDANFQKVPPGATDLKNAAVISLADVSVGDRVLARGELLAADKALIASSLVVMTKAEISKKHDADRAEWLKRGLAGVVTGAAPGQLTLRQGAKTVTIKLTERTRFRRYAPDSVRFDEAKPASLAEVNKGDQLRALGDRSEDGATIAAEAIVFGTFRTASGTVASVDAANSTIRMKENGSGKMLTVHLTVDSNLRRLPKGGSLEIDQLPRAALADLKSGEGIVVSSTMGSKPDELTAITLVAGIAPAAPSGRAAGLTPNWNLDIGLPQ